MSDTTSTQAPGTGVDWEGVQAGPEFGSLRKTLRGFVFPMTIAFLIWYFVYVLLADYAHGFMSTKVFGSINWGLILGVLQFVSTFLIALWYSRRANTKFDPLAERLRDEIEEGGR